MKTFKSVKAAVKFIDDQAGKGTEHIINDSLHFGVGTGVYAYSSDVKEAGLSVRGSAFTHLDRSETEDFLHYLLNKDGYLAC